LPFKQRFILMTDIPAIAHRAHEAPIMIEIQPAKSRTELESFSIESAIIVEVTEDVELITSPPESTVRIEVDGIMIGFVGLFIGFVVRFADGVVVGVSVGIVVGLEDGFADGIVVGASVGFVVVVGESVGD